MHSINNSQGGTYLARKTKSREHLTIDALSRNGSKLKHKESKPKDLNFNFSSMRSPTEMSEQSKKLASKKQKKNFKFEFDVLSPVKKFYNRYIS